MADLVCLRHSPHDLLSEALSKLKSSLPIDLVTLTFCGLPSDSKNGKTYSWSELADARDQAAPVDYSLPRQVWQSQSPIYIANMNMADGNGDESFATEIRNLHERKIQSYCALPLTNFRTRLGAMGFGSGSHLAFDRDQVRFLERATEIVAVAIDETLSGEEARSEIARLGLLADLDMASHEGGHEAMHSILHLIQEWAGEDVVGAYIFEQTSRSLRLEMPDAGWAEKMAPGGGLTALEGTLAGEAFRSRRSIILDYSGLAGLPFESVKRGLKLGVKALCLCPVLDSEETLGVLKIARRRELPFSAHDVEFLERLAAAIVPTMRAPKAMAVRPGKAALPFESQAIAYLNAMAPPAMGMMAGQMLEAAPLVRGSGQTSERSSQAAPAPEAAGIGFGILDTQFHFLAVNDVLARINGRPADEHIGKSVRELLGDVAEVVEPYIRSVVATGRPELNVELCLLLTGRNGPTQLIKHYLPIKDGSGNVTQVGVIVMETGGRRNLESSLKNVSENLRQQKKWQQVLAEISSALAGEWNVRKVFPKISALLRRVLRQEYAALTLREEDSGELVSKVLDFPMGRSLNVGGEIGAGVGTAGKALQEHSALIFDAEEVRRLDPQVAVKLVSEGLKSLCCVPLFRMKKPLGLMVLGSTRTNAFRHEDLMLLNQVAEQLAITLENASTLREVEQLKQRLKQEKRHLSPEVRGQHQFDEIIGKSPALQEVLDQVAIISASNATVMILGETGTGKGLVAHAIHRTSRRRERALVTLNCAAIPTGLLESELFGHEKGAFTGAINQKVGRLELADGGTLFLDEIGEISLELQPKLLRVLQEREFERLGGTRTIKVDLRLIAATNRDLGTSVEQKQFRSDLFYRLNVFPIRIPPLRNRPEDIPQLVRYFVKRSAGEIGRRIETIPTDVMEALIRWHWPGNVRELENFIERSVILTEGTALWAPLEEIRTDAYEASHTSLEQAEREHIVRILRETGGIIAGRGGAAQRLSMKRSTLQSKMQRLGIKREDYFRKM